MDDAQLNALRRNSGLRLTKGGQFFFHDRPVENTRVQTLFHGGLDVRPNGDVTLTVGQQWAFVECESVARFVHQLAPVDRALRLRLLDGHEVVTSKLCLGFVPSGAAFIWFEEPSHPPAQLLFGAHHAAGHHLRESAEGQVHFVLGERQWPVVQLDAPPRPHTPAPVQLDYSIGR